MNINVIAEFCIYRPLNDTEKVVNSRWRELNKERNRLKSTLSRRRARFAELTLHPASEDSPEKHLKWEQSKSTILEQIDELEKKVRPLKFLDWLGLGRRNYHYWREHYGLAHKHNARVARDHWILEEEKKAAIDFAQEYHLEGYRRLTFMMLDGDIVAICPSSTYRILKQAYLIRNKTDRTSQNGKGFVKIITTA